MPVFEWKGLDKAGKARKGLLDAESERVAKAKLKADGVFLTGIAETKSSGGGAIRKPEGGSLLSMEVDFSKYFQTVSQQEVMVMTRLMSNLVKANIPIVDALTAIIEQEENEKFKRVLSDIRERVNEGSSLSDGLAEHPKLFSAMYINMVRAGETSGALDIVMSRLADFTESQMGLRSKVKSAMTYPVLMAVFAVLVVALLFTVVIPKIVTIFQDLKITLPLSTRILIWLSEFVSGYWWLLGLMMGLTVWGFTRWKNSKKGSITWDRFKLNSPLFGSLIRSIAVSRFATTLATLMTSGVPLLTSIEIVKNVLNNQILQKVLEKAREDIREGESIAKPLQASGEFPSIVTHMIAIGERTGQLEEMLEHVSRQYDRQVEDKLTSMTALMEPAMILIMAGVVLFIVLSILLPIMQINQSLR